MSWLVVPLAAGHQRERFCCGVAQLDAYIRNYAGQHARKDVGRTFVALAPGENQVLGYYTLSATSVDFDRVPEALRKKLPRYHLPTALIGKLAVDESAKGLGELLLLDVLRRIVDVSGEMAIYAAEVHALDQPAATFYARYGFQAFLDQPQHLFLPLATIKQLF